jgi:hypothetical protein
MFDKSLQVLGSLLKNAPEKQRSSLLKFLPESEVLKIQKKDFSMPTGKPLSLEMIFDKIDDSWYIEKLKTLQKQDSTFLLSAFPKTKREELCLKLNLENTFYHFDPKLKTHLLSQFFKECFEEEIPIPTTFLKDSPLSFLVDASSKKIHKLCFYLGLNDLVIELKTVIKGSILTELEKALFPDELNFARDLIDQKTSYSFGNMGLSNWNEDIDVLRKVIFERGLFRLSIALKDSNDDFLWYIYHTLSKNLKTLFEKNLKNSVDERVYNIILEQTLTAWKGVCTVLN